jgi:two-component system chemotaxis response regulator CheY
MTTILHVEDDDALSDVVRDSFRAFGFRGSFLTATSIGEALAILEDIAANPVVDLILSDMHLADGTGLDVIRSVRSSTARADVPVIILSADTTPETVKRAYALGVNAYVPKGMRGRPINDTIKALYSHWLRDVRLPRSGRVRRTHRALDTAIHLRARRAQRFMDIAERLGSRDGLFWFDLALRDGNFANVWMFLEAQLGERELSPALLDEIEAAQRKQLDVLEHLDRHPVNTRKDAEDVIRMLVDAMHPDLFARVTAALCPAAPLAMSELRQTVADTIDEIARWVEKHATDEALRAHVDTLRTSAAWMRSSAADVAVM